MFFDIHTHAQRVEGAPRLGTKPWASVDQLLLRFDQIGIERGVVLPLIGPEFHEPQGNQDVLDMYRAHPDRIVPFCNIHPRAVGNSPGTDLGPLFEYHRAQGCRGVGEVTFNMPFSDPLMQNLFGHIERAGLPMTIHVSTRIGGCYGIYDDCGLPQLEMTLRRFKKLTILGHSPAFWSEIGKLETPADRDGYPRYSFDEEGVVPKLMRRYENLYGDLSAGSGHNALARNPDYAVQFLTEFQDRLLFGTDICAPDTPTPLVDFLVKLRESGRIDDAVFDKVARQNALRLLGLDGKDG